MVYFILLFFSLLTSCKVKQQEYTSTIILNDKGKFLKELNHIRKSGCMCGNVYMPPVPLLKWNNYLENSASHHAKDMYKKKYFNHVSLSGKTVKQRVEDSGYTSVGMRSFAVGENIAFGQKSIEDVMKSWLKSDEHCKNMMNKNYSEVGVAVVNSYWVQNFGRRIPFE